MAKIRKLFISLAIGCGLIAAGKISAQTFTTLRNFTDSDGNTTMGIVLSSNTLYGAAQDGGSAEDGTIFKVNVNGTGYAILHDFSMLIGPDFINSDGAGPQGLILSSNTLYGAAADGGGAGSGTIFRMNVDGTGFTTLHAFSADSFDTNSDGRQVTGLVLSSNILYGTTEVDGSTGNGTIFKVNTDGTGFTTLFTFPDYYDQHISQANSDGAEPNGMVLSSNVLYGSTYTGGSAGNGTIFTMNADGTGFATLYNFSAVDTEGLNNDGVNPTGSLILSNNTLYGTAGFGGSTGDGTIFQISTDGTGFTTLYNFSAIDENGFNNDGVDPSGGLILSSNTLYGAAWDGGSAGDGTVFSLTLSSSTTSAPPLNILPSGVNIILIWPIGGPIYRLQSSTNLGPTTVWNNVTSAPVVINGQNTLTNRISGTQMFFRLSQ